MTSFTHICSFVSFIYIYSIHFNFIWYLVSNSFHYHLFIYRDHLVIFVSVPHRIWVIHSTLHKKRPAVTLLLTSRILITEYSPPGAPSEWTLRSPWQSSGPSGLYSWASYRRETLAIWLRPCQPRSSSLSPYIFQVYPISVGFFCIKISD